MAKIACHGGGTFLSRSISSIVFEVLLFGGTILVKFFDFIQNSVLEKSSQVHKNYIIIIAYLAKHANQLPVIVALVYSYIGTLFAEMLVIG